MQENKFISLQKKLLFAGLVSLFLALLTVFALFGSMKMLYRSINRNREEQKIADIQNSYQQKENGITKAPAHYGNVSNYMPEGLKENSLNSQATEEESLIVSVASVLCIAVLFAFYFWLITRKYMSYLRELSDGICGFAKGKLEDYVEVR